MKHIVKTVIFTAVIALAAYSVPAAYAMPEIGKAAPDFEGVNVLDGSNFKLSDHKGQVVVLEWTNHECPFVHKHYDSGNMQATQAKAAELGALWVSIVSSCEGKQGFVSAEEAKKIVEEQGAHPAVKLLDPKGDIGHLYDAKTTPDMYIIDAQGNLAYSGALDNAPTPDPASVKDAENYVLEALNELHEGKSVSVPLTQPYGCGIKY